MPRKGLPLGVHGATLSHVTRGDVPTTVDERVDASVEPAGPATRSSARFSRLPADVRLEDTVAIQPTRPAPDPEAGRDTDRDFLFRYGVGG